MQFDGAVDNAIANYLSSAVDRGAHDGQVSFGPDGLTFDDLTVRSGACATKRERYGRSSTRRNRSPSRSSTSSRPRLPARRTVIALTTPEGEVAFQSTDQQTRDAELPAGRYLTSCTIPGGLLNGRMYIVHIGFDIPQRQDAAARRRPYLSFVVAARRSRRGLVAGRGESPTPLGDQPHLTIARYPAAVAPPTITQSNSTTRISSSRTIGHIAVTPNPRAVSASNVSRYDGAVRIERLHRYLGLQRTYPR
jgi:hypothetical protein